MAGLGIGSFGKTGVQMGTTGGKLEEWEMFHYAKFSSVSVHTRSDTCPNNYTMLLLFTKPCQVSHSRRHYLLWIYASSLISSGRTLASNNITAFVIPHTLGHLGSAHMYLLHHGSPFSTLDSLSIPTCSVPLGNISIVMTHKWTCGDKMVSPTLESTLKPSGKWLESQWVTMN